MLTTTATAILLIVQYISPTYGECFDAVLEDTIVEAHNNLRHDVAIKNLNTKVYGDIPGSKSMFNLEFDCGFAYLAEALIPKDCLGPALDYSSMGYGTNFRKFRTPKKVDESDHDYLKGYYDIVVHEWAAKDIVPLGSDVIFKDVRMQAFANMVYYKTIAFGCKHRTCDDTTFAIACVYESLPKTGEPLFEPNPQPKNKKGCTAHKTCKQIRPEAKCMQNPDGTLGPLCVLHDITTTSSTDSTSNRSWLKDSLKTQIEKNFRVAKNMNEMRYDMTLEAEAQVAADKCEATENVISENGQIAQLRTDVASLSDMETQDEWFSQIEEIKSYINFAMRFSNTLKNREDAPLAFTQVSLK
ncbi:unnamed protein product [Cylicocyclus nassatus]|uniref:SCP domain-containing protein n=1 Tax=Cylicocyclus nassatus TaxID=53992 RepID=A0AA36DVA8_CYLNA|nr:unnamed protein product [Cylicocyclus nassatus]